MPSTSAANIATQNRMANISQRPLSNHRLRCVNNSSTASLAQWEESFNRTWGNKRSTSKKTGHACPRSNGEPPTWGVFVRVPTWRLREPSYRSTVNHDPPRHWAWVTERGLCSALGRSAHLSPHGTSQPISNLVRPAGGERPLRHILMVDDDQAFCDAAGKALRKAG